MNWIASFIDNLLINVWVDQRVLLLETEICFYYFTVHECSNTSWSLLVKHVQMQCFLTWTGDVTWFFLHWVVSWSDSWFLWQWPPFNLITVANCQLSCLVLFDSINPSESFSFADLPVCDSTFQNLSHFLESGEHSEERKPWSYFWRSGIQMRESRTSNR